MFEDRNEQLIFPLDVTILVMFKVYFNWKYKIYMMKIYISTFFIKD